MIYYTSAIYLITNIDIDYSAKVIKRIFRKIFSTRIEKEGQHVVKRCQDE